MIRLNGNRNNAVEDFLNRLPPLKPNEKTGIAAISGALFSAFCCTQIQEILNLLQGHICIVDIPKSLGGQNIGLFLIIGAVSAAFASVIKLRFSAEERKKNPLVVNFAASCLATGALFGLSIIAKKVDLIAAPITLAGILSIAMASFTSLNALSCFREI